MKHEEAYIKITNLPNHIIVSVAFLLILARFMLEQSIWDQWKLRLMFAGEND